LSEKLKEWKCLLDTVGLATTKLQTKSLPLDDVPEATLPDESEKESV